VLLIGVTVVFLCLNKQVLQKPPATELTNAVTESPPQLPETNLAEVASSTTAVEFSQQPTNAPESITTLTNALTAMNIEQWKAAIKGLHKMIGLSESWHMEQTNQEEYILVPIEKNGQNIDYKLRFIDISVKNQNGDILEAQLRSPMMSIDETRELGLQLCNILGNDPTGFSTWCDKVGNHWMDTPLYSTGNHYYGFETFHTYNDEKPWSISFQIMNP
jgi:hypothetical protein